MGIELWDSMTSARSKLGPFRINASLNITNAGYNSNIYPGSEEDPVGDGTMFAGPNLGIYLPVSKTIVFDIFESPYYAFYLKTRRERAWNNVFSGKVHFLLKKVYFVIGGGSSNIRQIASTELDFPLRIKQDQAIGSFLWQLRPRISLLISSDWTKFAYGDPAFGELEIYQRLNRQETKIRLTAYKQTGPRTRLHFDGEYGSFVFGYFSENRDSRSFTISGGLDMEALSRVQGTVNLGFKYFDNLNPERQDYRGLFAETNLAWSLSPRWILQGSLQRGPQFSVWSDYLFYIQTIWGGGLSHQMLQWILLAYDFSYGRNLYPRGEQEGETVRSDSYSTHSGRIEIQLGRSTKLSLIAIFSTRRSSFEFFNYDRTFIGFNLVHDF